MPVAHETATLFFALLALLLGLSVLAIGVLMVVDRRDQIGVLGIIRPLALEGAALVAVTCTVGSLYLSEVAGFLPCRLCWIQRGFMYPAAVLLVLALITKRAVLRLVAAALAVIGLAVSIFHRYEQAYGGIGDFCEADNPCSLRWVNEFGFPTIPTMAGIGFLPIAALLGLRHLDDRQAAAAIEPDDERVPASNRS